MSASPSHRSPSPAVAPSTAPLIPGLAGAAVRPATAPAPLAAGPAAGRDPGSAVAVAARLRAAGCVFAEDEASLILATATTPAGVAAMVDRRAAGLPLEHVLGWAEFRGLRVAVDPGVFVPRRRTEFLVDQAVTLTAPDAVILDLCCGSGALGVALAVTARRAQLHAADIDPAAVACARRNVAAVAARLAGPARVYEGDLYAPLPPTLRGRVDVLLANAPYVPTDAIDLLPAEARLHEARMAFDGGADGLAVLRRVAAGAPLWLRPGGHLLFETSERQASRAVETVERAGLRARVATSDEYSATVVIATRPPS
ncbi:putative protein N(5)-glutamine methyltransferase [Sphaerisporangium sp. NPDC005289]|uniref:putative protein N(5)-glutamine methyltransferase n=1 Tax=Sphaerisporangium sp. NPDC005289 TaxID=3155247 RepID=UPI0033BEDECA